MNITNHAYDRYVERIIGIADTQNIRQYLAQNKERVTEEINNMYTYAKFIISMQINGDKSTKNYWLRDNIVLVMDTENSAVITLYRVDFGFGEKTDRLIANNLIEEIEVQQQLIKELKANAEEIVASKKLEIACIEEEVERLNQQIFMLNYKKETLQKEIKVQYNDAEIINKKMEVNALKICNSMEYKNELSKIIGR